jgi:hypothetical protein
MKTEISFIGGETASFDDEATVNMSAHGVEIVERDGEETIRVLFPWNRIEKVTQRGIEVTGVYTF